MSKGQADSRRRLAWALLLFVAGQQSLSLLLDNGVPLVRFPALLYLFPHLWITLGRMLRAGHVGKALTLFPWLFTGEVARIRGFHSARRADLRSGAVVRAA